MRPLRNHDPRSQRPTVCLPDDNPPEVATVGLSQTNDLGFGYSLGRLDLRRGASFLACSQLPTHRWRQHGLKRVEPCQVAILPAADFLDFDVLAMFKPSWGNLRFPKKQ